MRKAKGIYLPGDKNPRQWGICKGCGEPALMRIGRTEGAKGYCTRACADKHRRGDAHSSWKGADATYGGFHDRVNAHRGRPGHCSRCGRDDDDTTYQWANLTGNYPDVNDYAPMCTACHGEFDAHSKARGSANGNAKLTEQIVAEARRRHAAGETAQAMAREYGVSKAALCHAIKGETWKHVA